MDKVWIPYSLQENKRWVRSGITWRELYFKIIVLSELNGGSQMSGGLFVLKLVGKKSFKMEGN